jgi:hypothetical protein
LLKIHNFGADPREYLFQAVGELKDGVGFTKTYTVVQLRTIEFTVFIRSTYRTGSRTVLEFVTGRCFNDPQQTMMSYGCLQITTKNLMQPRSSHFLRDRRLRFEK